MRFQTFLRSSLAVAALGAAIACADNATPTSPRIASAPSVDFAVVKSAKKPKVAKCKLQKEEWGTALIGSNGGTVTVGGASLTVPAGALNRTVSISAHALPTTSASVQFSPEGLHFALPAKLTMQYGKCETPTYGVTVAYVQKDTVTEVEPSNDHPLLKSVTAEISHFSSYAVAY
jgi:hypothetical protein